MRGRSRTLVMLGVTLVGALALTKALYAWPALLPQPLRRLGNAIIDASGSGSIETSTDLEWVYLFVLCVLVMGMLVVLVQWLGARWFRRP